MNNKDKLYNVIFPVWFLWLVPPVILVVALGNFVVDSLVLFLAYRLFVAQKGKLRFWEFIPPMYCQSLAVWLFS